MKLSNTTIMTNLLTHFTALVRCVAAVCLNTWVYYRLLIKLRNLISARNCANVASVLIDDELQCFKHLLKTQTTILNLKKG